MVNAVSSLFAEKVLAELKKCGITHIVWLPHSENKAMYETVLQDAGITLVPVCREGECIPIAAGLWLGGKNPTIMHQSTGLFEAGDSVRGLALDMQLPLLMLIGARGWPTPGSPPSPYSWNGIDSAATFLEPILDAWGIKHHLVTNENETSHISLAYKEAQTTSRPVAVLIAKE